jgi:hypothetical protein
MLKKIFTDDTTRFFNNKLFKLPLIYQLRKGIISTLKMIIKLVAGDDKNPLEVLNG